MRFALLHGIACATALPLIALAQGVPIIDGTRVSNLISRLAAEYMEDTLASAGLSSETLAGLSSSTNPQDKRIAQTAAASATAMGVAQLSYEEAAQSLERIEGLVDEIASQDTLKESIDLNTRMAAETNYMLGQMWRLNAATGLATGQTGVNWAAEQAKEKSFFDYSGAN